MARPQFVYNGPANLADLKQVNLAGAQFFFNGPYDLRQLKEVDFKGATISFNGVLADASELGKPEEDVLPSSPHRASSISEARTAIYPSRPEVDSYRPLRTSDHYRPIAGIEKNSSRRQPRSRRSRRNDSKENLKGVDWFGTAMLKAFETPDLSLDNAFRDAYANDPRRLSRQDRSESAEASIIKQATRVPSCEEREKLQSPKEPSSSPSEAAVLEYTAHGANALPLGIRRIHTSSEEKVAEKLHTKSKQWVHPDRQISLRTPRSSSPSIQEPEYEATSANAIAVGVRERKAVVNVSKNQAHSMPSASLVGNGQQPEKSISKGSAGLLLEAGSNMNSSPRLGRLQERSGISRLKRERSSSPAVSRITFAPRGFHEMISGGKPTTSADQKIRLCDAIHEKASLRLQDVHVNGSSREGRQNRVESVQQGMLYGDSEFDESHFAASSQRTTSLLESLASGIDTDIITAKHTYAIAEKKLRLERQEHGRASESAIRRLKDSGRALAACYDASGPEAHRTTEQRYRNETESVPYIKEEPVDDATVTTPKSKIVGPEKLGANESEADRFLACLEHLES